MQMQLLYNETCNSTKTNWLKEAGRFLSSLLHETLNKRCIYMETSFIMINVTWSSNYVIVLRCSSDANLVNV